MGALEPVVENKLQIGQLALALSQAQAEITGALKESANPFFKSKYADLASCWDACRKPLSKNKLAVIQTTEEDDNGVIIVTTLAHESGEYIQGKLKLKPVKNDPQGVGSAITYGRRYGLCAIVGLAQVDDDGNAASAPSAQPKKSLSDCKKILDAAMTTEALDKLWRDNATLFSGLNKKDHSELVDHAKMIKSVLMEDTTNA